MNTTTEFNQRQRFEKNKSKARRHEPRAESVSSIIHGVNDRNKKERMSIKNFKRNQCIERDPFIGLWRCEPTESERQDWVDWLDDE
tara:strand:- start:2283 stop:2540 length:258 start_codon:yes stop_codon:yes gene_type:complete